MKWPYKEMYGRISDASDRSQDKGEVAESSDAASDETTSDIAGQADITAISRSEAIMPGHRVTEENEAGFTVPKPAPRQDDDEVKAAVAALLGLTK